MSNPIHIQSGCDIAPLVLMPGDPLRAKYIAEKYLENPVLVTSIRNMLGYTGYYKGVKVTTMGSGMGMPSMGIYAHELFECFDVQKIIRVGTCGSCDKTVAIGEIILASSAYSETNFAFTYDSQKRDLVYPNQMLNDTINDLAIKQNIKLHIGTVLTSDVFCPYAQMDKVYARVPEGINILGEEMEAYALFMLGEKMHRETACIATVVDSHFTNRILPVEDRERALDTMITLALDAIIK